MKVLVFLTCLMASLSTLATSQPKNLNEALTLFAAADSAPGFSDFSKSGQCVRYSKAAPLDRQFFSYAKQTHYVTPTFLVHKVVVGMFAGTYGNERLSYIKNEESDEAYIIRVAPNFFADDKNGLTIYFRKDGTANQMPFIVVNGKNENELLMAGVCPLKRN